MASRTPDLTKLFAPRHIVMVGASSDVSKLRGQTLRTLLHNGFDGPVYPVSRSEAEILGLKAHRSVADALAAHGGPVDLAILAIPAEHVPAELERCGAAGIGAAVIITSGFAEQAGAEGAELQRQLQSTIDRYGMAVLGPNAQGFANLAQNLCATFSPAVRNRDEPLMPEWHDEGGRISVIAQSGALGFALYDAGRRRELPFRHVITTGNEAGVSAFDAADFLLDEGGTEVFLMFLEGIRDAEAFRRVAERALRANKPIIVAKVGRSEAAERSAASHTGALAGSFRAHQAMFDAYGVMLAESHEDMIDLASAFLANRSRLPKGRRIGISTSSGGAGGWTADAVTAMGLEVPELAPEARARIDTHLPPYGSSVNPVDGTAQAIGAVGNAGLAKLTASASNIDGVIGVTTAVDPSSFDKEGDRFAAVGRELEKPIVFWSYTFASRPVYELFARNRYPLATNLRAAARMMAAMAQYREAQEQFSPPLVAACGAASTLETVALTEREARIWLAERGVGAAPGGLAESPGDAARIAQALGAPAAFKIQSPDLPHKSDAGGVALNIAPGEAADAYAAMIERVRLNVPEARLDGVLIEPMAASGHEILLGITRDALFGPMLLIGSGGIYAEILEDTALSPLLDDRASVERLISSLRSAPILDGARGRPRLDKPALVDLVLALCRVAAENADLIEEIDLNPVIVHETGKGVSVLDALLVQRA